MKRYLSNFIAKDLASKMVFLSGPRQTGKTTLAKALLQEQGFNDDYYFNWDDEEDRLKILKKRLPGASGTLVFDEIHKYPRWRNYLKGLFDKKGHYYKMLVTGSAKLDYYRRGGDSLQGRYNHFRLHPLSLKEVEDMQAGTFEDLLRFGGFPEPFFKKDDIEVRKWSNQYHMRLVREELTSLEKIHEISLVEDMVFRLPDLVGGPLSINSLREDLRVSHQTASKWLEALERLYSIFRVHPFGAPKIRAVKKEAKHYHFDWTIVENPGLRFENMIACHLLKWCHFQEDVYGWRMELRYFRDTDKREVDFVILKNRKPMQFIECKLSDQKASPHLIYLKKKFPTVESLQLVESQEVDISYENDIRVIDARKFLRKLI